MKLKDAIFNIKTDGEFEALALDIFKFQFENNPIYRSYCDLLYKHPSDIKHIEDIPFLPIQFFKSHKVVSGNPTIQKIFSSSGTTGSITSQHYIGDLSLYEKSFYKGFEFVYGDIEDYTLLALLPSYLEREGSSLVYMVDHLIKTTKSTKSGFFLNDLNALIETLNKLEDNNQKTLLIGVSFALLDLAERKKLTLNNTIVMETGGMKGRRKEMIREELHKTLNTSFGTDRIHSEYGMTELLSQAYSKGHGLFTCPPWMKILVRDPEDPFSLLPKGKTGGINVIDLANINSCAFIATQDLGKVHANEQFEVIGRFDHSDIRGCNLMAL